MMETSISDFHTSFYITAIKTSHFTFHTYKFQVPITVVTHAVNNSNAAVQIKMCCIVVVMIRECQLVLHTIYSLNNMVEIYMRLLKALHWSALLHQHIQKQQHHHNHEHVMLCFINFGLMIANMILTQLLKTANTSLNF